MRRVWISLGLPLTMLLGIGCANTDYLKPPKQPEEFTLPPEADARFSEPINYPKSVMFQDSLHSKDVDPNGPGSGMHAGGPGGAGMR